jgi:hypothetical protein
MMSQWLSEPPGQLPDRCFPHRQAGRSLAGSSLVAGTGLVGDFIVRQRIALANQTVRRSAGISSLNFKLRHFTILRDDLLSDDGLMPLLESAARDSWGECAG